MLYVKRLLIGLVFVFCSLVALWIGSPARTGAGEPSLVAALAFVFLFALGFIFVAMGFLGIKDDYPGMLSGLVLYFMVGALISVFLYVRSTPMGPLTLEDAAKGAFWLKWARVTAMWPLELVQRAEILDYHLLRLDSR